MIYIMSLAELIDNSCTDKNTTHSYLYLYEKLLQSKKFTAKNVLEIGIQGGGSIKLWHDYFPNADVYGLDIMHINDVLSELKDQTRIHLLTSIDAYDLSFFENTLLSKNIRFDMILDDGPHTLESMIIFISRYSKLLTDDGILILEDIQSSDWFEILKSCVPNNLKKYIEIYDLREIKGRYDDLVLVINKNKIVDC